MPESTALLMHVVFESGKVYRDVAWYDKAGDAEGWKLVDLVLATRSAHPHFAEGAQPGDDTSMPCLTVQSSAAASETLDVSMAKLVKKIGTRMPQLGSTVVLEMSHYVVVPSENVPAEHKTPSPHDEFCIDLRPKKDSASTSVLTVSFPTQVSFLMWLKVLGDASIQIEDKIAFDVPKADKERYQSI
jgi:hypothetical protein